MGRRSDLELVEEIMVFFIDRKGNREVTLKEFCDALGINSATAKKWLEILSFVKMMCPDFYLEEEAGRNLLIKFHEISIYARPPNHIASNSKSS